MVTTDLVDMLVNRRKELGLSQRELAKRCNMPQSTIARIETHQISPQIDTLTVIADKLSSRLLLESKSKNKWNGSHISVFWKDELTAEVDIQNNKVDIKKYTSDPIKQFFLAFNSMDIVGFSDLLEARCWERERVDILDLLRKIGLDEYDPIEIVRRTFGVSYNDSIWFKFEESNINWKKLCPKGEAYV